MVSMRWQDDSADRLRRVGRVGAALVLVGIIAGVLLAILAAVLGFVAHNLLFTAPYFSLSVANHSDLLNLFVLLIVGMRRDSRALRYFSLGAMLLTIAKVFLYDLANVGGIYRSLSFLGLAVSLILVSLLYQRFVFKNAARRPPPAG